VLRICKIFFKNFAYVLFMKFLYKANNKEGKEEKGEVEAPSKKIALEILERKNLSVFSLQERGGLLGKGLGTNISLGQRVSSKDLVIFTRQFSIMLKSSIPPLEALRAQIVQTSNGYFKNQLLKMAEALETGSSLSRAFSLPGKIFNVFYISTIKAGEATGKVADALHYLAEHLEGSYNLKRKIQGAMMYPAFIIVVFIGAFFLVTFFIVPKLTEIMASFQGQLPWTTKLIMGISGFVRKGGWAVILGLFGFLFFLPNLLKRFPSGKKVYDKFILKAPIIGNFRKKIFLSQFAENLSVLIAAGLPITQALKITKDIINNTLYQFILERAEERVSRGEKISTILSGFPEQFPGFVVQMVSTGEETGRLDETLINVVKFYQEEINRTVEGLASIIEPILIVLLGVGIAFLAAAVYVPIFQMGMSGGGG